MQFGSVRRAERHGSGRAVVPPWSMPRRQVDDAEQLAVFGDRERRTAHTGDALDSGSEPFWRRLRSLPRERENGIHRALADRAALYPTLPAMLTSGAISESRAANAIASTAEGYSFPTNLDRDPPIGGLAPETQRALFHRALKAGWTPAAFQQALDDQATRKLT